MAVEVDWGPIEDVCRVRSMALEKNDRDLRKPYDEAGPVAHTDSCWLGKNYANQPNVWYHGCDCGALKNAGRTG